MFSMKKVESNFSHSDRLLREVADLLFPKFDVREVEGLRGFVLQPPVFDLAAGRSREQDKGFHQQYCTLRPR